MFFGDCKFRDVSFIPRNTFLTKSSRVIDVVKKIIKENETINYKSKRDIVQVLSVAVENGNSQNISGIHIKNIKDMLGEDRIFQ